MNLKLKNSLAFLSFASLLFLVFIKPIGKYFQYVHDGLAFNSALILLFIFFLVLIISLTHIFINKFKIPTKYKYSKSFVVIITLSIIIVTYTSLVGLANFPILYHEVGVKNYLIRFVNSITMYWLFVFLGLYILDLFYSVKHKLIIKISWYIFSFIILFFTLTNDNGFKLYLAGEPIYLMLADPFALLSIIMLSYYSNGLVKGFYLAISSMVLFLLSSRAALIFFLFSYLIVFLFKYKKSAVILGCIISFIAYQMDVYELINENGSNRMFRFFLTGEDSSLYKRNLILESGLNDLKENWFTGNYMGDYLYSGTLGRYIHNYLSFWRQFGLIPFLLLLINVLYLYIVLLKKYIKTKNDSVLEFLFVYSTFFLAETLFARAFISPYIWLILTAVPIYFYTTKYEEKSTC